MYRKIERVLTEWNERIGRQPLMLIGARQVGKTWAIQDFCQRTYGKEYIYLNFEKEQSLQSLFEDSLDPQTILRRLGITLGKTITPEIPIVLDEIQRCEPAITALKYFCEAKEDYRIIAAGSLLGVKLRRFETSFPVGKVQMEWMYPLDFEEFLIAAGEELLRDEIRSSVKKMLPVPEMIHQKALQLYLDYLFVGGMPQCVQDYLDVEKNVLRFHPEIQDHILLAYAADMTKYILNAAESVKIHALYESIPRQLARENPKFKYRDIRPNANNRDFASSLDWLIASGMAYQVQKVDLPQAPLKAYIDESSFKIYLSDVGLLCRVSEMEIRDLQPESMNMFKGAVTENYVMQAMKAMRKSLYYYKPDNSMEIDLLLNSPSGVIPVEVKAGRHKRSTSLKKYEEKYRPDRMIRLSALNFGQHDHLSSIPLYAVFAMDEML